MFRYGSAPIFARPTWRNEPKSSEKKKRKPSRTIWKRKKREHVGSEKFSHCSDCVCLFIYFWVFLVNKIYPKFLFFELMQLSTVGRQKAMRLVGKSAMLAGRDVVAGIEEPLLEVGCRWKRTGEGDRGLHLVSINRSLRMRYMKHQEFIADCPVKKLDVQSTCLIAKWDINGILRGAGFPWWVWCRLQNPWNQASWRP